MQSPDACHGAIDDASQFGAKFLRAALKEALLRFFGGKPGGVSIRFLRRFQPRHFAKVGSDGKLWRGESGSSRSLAFCYTCSVAFATEVTGKGDCFHPAMNASLFKSLEGSGLCVRKAGLNAAFGENPASTAGLHQQEFDAAFTDAVTNSGDLLPFFRKP